MTKKKVLIFIDWFLPGYKAGGPIQSVVNLINHLGEKYDFYVVTSNKDLGVPEPYQNISFNRWIHKDKYHVIYLDENHQNLKKYRELLKEKDYDVFYFNSLFSLNFTLKPLALYRNLSCKMILAPRGMLGEGALQLKKRKKQLFLNVFRLFRFNRKIIWHATAASEAMEIKNHFGQKSTVRIATNLSAIIGDKQVPKRKREYQLNLFFLSRISKKKNLKAALELLSKIRPTYEVAFSIIGPIEDQDYWRECKKVIEQLPTNVLVEYKGAVPNYDLAKHLRHQHFMLLPTFHENFGHVIMESWQNACPVIISNNTPWTRLQEQKTGFDIPLDKPETFISAIERAAAMGQKEYDSWSNAAFKFAQEYCNDRKAIEANMKLFL